MCIRDSANILQQQLKEEGITIYTATKAVKARYDDSLFHLTITDASGKGQNSTLTAEALLVAAGRKPNIDSLALDAAGVIFTSRGIPTDTRMKTNVCHIYACGDINGLFPFTHVAGYEAGIALTNAILRLPRKADYSKICLLYTSPSP